MIPFQNSIDNYQLK